jgi:hypothetical protein
LILEISHVISIQCVDILLLAVPSQVNELKRAGVHRNSYADLERHLLWVQALPGLFGISDHDLLFARKAKGAPGTHQLWVLKTIFKNYDLKLHMRFTFSWYVLQVL